MKKILILICISVIGGSIFSQIEAQSWKQSDSEIKKIFESEQYYEIINKYAPKPKKDLSLDELIYVGWAYYMFGEIDKAKEYSDIALKKGDQNATVYYLKGLIDLSKKKTDEALEAYEKAIKLDMSVGNYYTAVGNIYMDKGDIQKAIDYYNLGITVSKPSEQAYYMLADTYAGIGDKEKALKSFYEAKAQVQKDKELYATILYNIGTMEMDRKKYKKAIVAFSELIEYFPDDYYTHTSLVQCCYALQDYIMGDMYKDNLYIAYQNGTLTGSEFADKFCVDNFMIDSKMVSCYEYFQSTTFEDAENVPIYIFYVVNPNGMIEAELRYNYIADRNEDKGSFELTAHRVDTGELSSIIFDKDQSYIDLKMIVENGIDADYKLVSTAKYRFD